jgi:splicing factor U2AF subunit
VYFGNLTMGLVTPDMLRELCNGALAPLCPDAATAPPVVGVSMDSEGKYAFVEMKTEELATAALHLDKVKIMRISRFCWGEGR